MQVQAIQLCQGPDVIATLKEDHGLDRRWYVHIPYSGGKEEIVANDEENAKLYHCISGDFTGYMVFRCVEYEDVQICVIL